VLPPCSVVPEPQTTSTRIASARGQYTQRTHTRAHIVVASHALHHCPARSLARVRAPDCGSKSPRHAQPRSGQTTRRDHAHRAQPLTRILAADRHAPAPVRLASSHRQSSLSSALAQTRRPLTSLAQPSRHGVASQASRETRSTCGLAPQEGHAGTRGPEGEVSHTHTVSTQPASEVAPVERNRSGRACFSRHRALQTPSLLRTVADASVVLASPCPGPVASSSRRRWRR
jgi:hypothetical protein